MKEDDIMPGNQIVINNAIKYYVGDSKMDELLAWLDSNGVKENGKRTFLLLNARRYPYVRSVVSR